MSTSFYLVERPFRAQWARGIGHGCALHNSPVERSHRRANMLVPPEFRVNGQSQRLLRQPLADRKITRPIPKGPQSIPCRCVYFRQECVGLFRPRNVTKMLADFGGFNRLRGLDPGYRGSSRASIRTGWPPTLWDGAIVPPGSRTRLRRSDRKYESDS